MSINSFLRQPAILYPKSGYDKFGRDISGSAINTRCRFENKTATKTLKTGQVIMIMGMVFLPGELTVNTEDRISIQGINYKIYSVNGDIDQRGRQRLIECEVQKWAPI